MTSRWLRGSALVSSRSTSETRSTKLRTEAFSLREHKLVQELVLLGGLVAEKQNVRHGEGVSRSFGKVRGIS